LTQPSAPALRPLSVGEIADRAASLYRRDFPLLFSMAFVPHALLYLMTLTIMFLTTGAAALDKESASLLWMVTTPFIMVVAIFVGVLRLGALASALSDRYMGRPASLRGAYAVALRSWLRLFATVLLGGALILIVFVAGGVPGAMMAGFVIAISTDKVLGGIGALFIVVLCLGPGFFVFLRFLFAVYIPLVPVVERQWAMAGLVRSWRLMGYRAPDWGRLGTNPYRATALFVLLFALYLAVVFLAEVPYYILVGYQAYEQAFRGGPILSDPTLGAPLWLLIPAQLLAVTAQALMLPYTASVFTIYYYDLRVRREGLDFFSELGEAQDEGQAA